MKTIRKTIPQTMIPELSGALPAFPDRNPSLSGAVFLDIETTGFSAERSPVYLIGACCLQEGGLAFMQWLAENPSEEPDLLKAAWEELRPFSKVVTFNGATFDLPFLRKRAEKQGLEGLFLFPESLDLFQEIRPLKGFLQLPDCRQKTLEAFLGIPREDRYSSGELIDIYRKYARQPDPDSERLLLLHNEEDVLAMPRLLPLLVYGELKNGVFTLEAPSLKVPQAGRFSEVPPANPLEDMPRLDFLFTLSLRVPAGMFWEKDGIRLSLRGRQAQMSFPVYRGELKLFFEDYKNYYYLPAEDMAVHKSVAQYVEKEFRQKATRETAYQRKTGAFLLLPPGLPVPHPFRAEAGGSAFLLLSELPRTPDFWAECLRAFFRSLS